MKKLAIKTGFLLSTMLVCIMHLNAQVDTLSLVTPQKKGKITLSDGVMVSYKDLKVMNDTVYFTGESGLQESLAGMDIYNITRTKRQTAKYAVSMGLGGLLGGLLGTISWNGTELEDYKATYIVGATVVCAGIGAIVGSLIKKEKLVYRNPDVDFSFRQIRMKPTDEKYYAFGVKIKI